MHPAWSILLFTTTAGLAQGLVVVLALACLLGAAPHASFLAAALAAAAVLLAAALVASFFHLGHPRRAWRAALMWRTSWMSREVIVLPAFIVVVFGWSASTASGASATLTHTLLPLAALVPLITASSVVLLALLGALAARLGGAPALNGSVRVAFWGAAAMALTWLVGRLFGTSGS